MDKESLRKLMTLTLQGLGAKVDYGTSGDVPLQATDKWGRKFEVRVPDISDGFELMYNRVKSEIMIGMIAGQAGFFAPEETAMAGSVEE